MSTYKSFPQSNLIREWDKLLKLSESEVTSLFNEWKVIDEENKELSRNLLNKRNEKIDEVVNCLKLSGIDVFKYKKKSFYREKNGYQTWFKNNVVDVITKKYPYYNGSIPTAHMMEFELDGIKLYNNQSPTTIVELYKKIKFQYDSKIKEINKKNKLLINSIEYANLNGIEIEDLSIKDIISIVNEHAIENYLKENYPDGTLVYLDNECYDCSEFIVGNHRCSCGNRRISICVEGNILEGFYAYPEAY